MSSIEAANALFAIQSQWLQSECKSAPDLIIGTTNVYGTIPFSSLVFSGPGYCGNEWIADCTHPGICAASLDLGMTFGYESFQTSYLYSLPASPKDWLFPIGSKSMSYCQLSTANETDLLLAGSSVCYNQCKCDQNTQLLVFNDNACQLFNQTVSTDQPALDLQIGQSVYNISRFTVLNATEGVVWTTYITSNTTPLVIGEKLWVLALFLLVISLVLCAIHVVISAFLMYKHKGTRRMIYMVYLVGFLLCICDNVTSFLAYADGLFNSGYNGILFGLDSGITFALNGVCLMEIVYHKTWQRVLISVILIVLYGMFGLPYLFYMLFEYDYTSSFGIWINGYFNSVGFPGWQIISMALDPITVGIIMAFIIQQSLSQFKIKSMTIIQIFWKDTYLICLIAISFINFLVCVFLEMATTYTFFAQNDKLMNVYQVVASIQHSINACCTIWFWTYFPKLLTHMKNLKKTSQAKRSDPSGNGASRKNITTFIKRFYTVKQSRV